MKLKTRLIITFLTIILLPLALACTAFLFISGFLSKGQEEYGLRNNDYNLLVDPAQASRTISDQLFFELDQLLENNPSALEDPEIFAEMNEQIADKSSYVLVRRQDKIYYAGNELAANQIFDKLPGFEQVCHGLLQVLLVYISRKQNLSVISDSSFQLSKECALAKRYIDSNYSQNITLDSLAEITHINKFYLAHSFTECVGQSPINYLTDRRLEACKGLLVSSNLSVAQVATSVGFSSQSYFSQIFRKKTGMTPRQYRSRYARK